MSFEITARGLRAVVWTSAIAGALGTLAIRNGCSNRNKTVEEKPAQEQETVIDFDTDPALRRTQFIPNEINSSISKRTEFEALLKEKDKK